MEGEWIVERLVNYFKSPKWRYPVDNFVEQRCIGSYKFIVE